MFCANDLLAIGMLQALTGNGFGCPDDIALIGYDDIDFARSAAVPLSSIRQPSADIGATAIDLLLGGGRVAAGRTEPRGVPSGALVARASTGYLMV